MSTTDPIQLDRPSPGHPLPVIRCPKVLTIATDTAREMELESRRTELLRMMDAKEISIVDVQKLGAIKIELEAIHRRAAMQANK